MIYGFTIDRTTRLDCILRFLARLPKRGTVRLLCDPPSSGFEWEQLREPCRQISAVADVMICVCDSTAMKEFTLPAYIDRTRKAIAEYSRWAKWFEVGNEIGGDWMGPDDVVAEKVSSALNICRFAGVKTAVTWYLSGTFPGRSRSVVATWNLPSDLALYSWYPNYSPKYEPDWDDWFRLLAMKYPNAQVGFGEFGAEPNMKTHTHRTQIIQKIYAIKPDCPRFIGGYFYWDTWLDVCGRRWDDVTAALISNIPRVTLEP